MKSNPPSESPLLSISPARRFALVISRFLTALTLSLWIGGMAFFGITAAPVLFHPEKSGIERATNTAVMAPQMVGAMLTRFGTLTNICIVLLVAGWLLDGVLSGSLKQRLWQVQGLLTLICLAFSQYLNIILLPQTKADQAQILPIIARAERGEKLSATEKEKRVTFDNGHKGYQKLATINLYVLMAILLLLLARPLPVTAQRD